MQRFEQVSTGGQHYAAAEDATSISYDRQPERFDCERAALSARHEARSRQGREQRQPGGNTAMNGLTITNKPTITLSLTANDWELYSHLPGAAQTARELNRSLEEAGNPAES
jgi:hypothetical protein